MKKLSLIFEELIMELTASEIREKYYSDIDEKEFNKIVSADPKTKVKGDEVKKIGKYAKILLDMFKKDNLKLEDLPKANEYLSIVYKKQLPLKANMIKTLPDMYDVIKDYVVQAGETNVTKLVDSLEEEDYELLHNGEKWLVFKPKTEKGACTLGSATEWCTAWGKHSTNPKYKGRNNMFNQYGKSGTIYTIINKKDNTDKYQFHVQSAQYMDKNDSQINVSNFLDNNEELLYFFNPELKGDMSNISDDDLDSMINRKLITNNARTWVIDELVKRNATKPIVNLLLKSEEEDDYDEINKQLSSDLQISDIVRDDIEFKNLDDPDLSIYDSLGGYYYEPDVYIDDEEPGYYYDNSIEEMFNQKKDDLEIKFSGEGLDIKEFLKYLEDQKSGVGYSDGVYDKDFLNNLIINSDKKDKVLEKIHEIISDATYDANREANQQVANKSDGLFSISNNEIEKSIFMLFLIRYDDYDMDEFKDFLSSTFQIPVEGYEIYEEVRELENQILNVDINQIVEVYDDIEDDIVEHFIEQFEDEIIEFHHETGDDEETKDWFKNVSGDEYHSDLSNARELLYNMVHKYTDSYSMYMSDAYRTLQIYDRKINIPKKTVYIHFQDNMTDKDFSGYVRIDQLPKYITYGTKSGPFWDKLSKIMTDMKLDMNKDSFENEMVKLRIDYSKFNFEKEEIFIELTDKKSGKTMSGMVKIETLPTHFSNYKLFEAINRFKDLL
jgi:hypothetical protein